MDRDGPWLANQKRLCFPMAMGHAMVHNSKLTTGPQNLVPINCFELLHVQQQSIAASLAIWLVEPPTMSKLFFSPPP